MDTVDDTFKLKRHLVSFRLEPIEFHIFKKTYAQLESVTYSAYAYMDMQDIPASMPLHALLQ